MKTTSEKLNETFGNMFNSGPVAENVITSAESELGLLFPPSYRLYLARFGASLGLGVEIFGLPAKTAPDQTPQWADVVKATLRLRPKSLPKNSISISHDGVELGFFLVCSTIDVHFEGPVIEWGPVHDGGNICAQSFLDFVENHIRQ